MGCIKNLGGSCPSHKTLAKRSRGNVVHRQAAAHTVTQRARGQMRQAGPVSRMHPRKPPVAVIERLVSCTNAPGGARNLHRPHGGAKNKKKGLGLIVR
jgi:hypothetical protein